MPSVEDPSTRDFSPRSKEAIRQAELDMQKYIDQPSLTDSNPVLLKLQMKPCLI